ncbi:hypothetical protein LX36DRAFT_153076 [Colletotrichum falcatum]|nr:hypothetical protein LX36DRAFT_153076 [Colletotrichum falcatum]
MSSSSSSSARGPVGRLSLLTGSLARQYRHVLVNSEGDTASSSGNTAAQCLFMYSPAVPWTSRTALALSASARTTTMPTHADTRSSSMPSMSEAEGSRHAGDPDSSAALWIARACASSSTESCLSACASQLSAFIANRRRCPPWFFIRSRAVLYTASGLVDSPANLLLNPARLWVEARDWMCKSARRNLDCGRGGRGFQTVSTGSTRGPRSDGEPLTFRGTFS